MSETMQDKLRNALESNCRAWGCVDPRIAAAEMARKALETLREPTPEMVDAGRTKTNWGAFGTDEVWVAMIEAGLDPSPTPSPQ